MSYIDEIPEEKLGEYEVIQDWNAYFSPKIYERRTQVGFFNARLEITNKIIESVVLFLGGVYEFEVKFENCYFKESLDLAAHFKGAFTLSKCFIEKGISSMLESRIDGEFSMYDVFTKSMFIHEGIFGNCFWNFSDPEKCIIAGGSFNDLQIIVGEKGIETFFISATKLNGSLRINGANHTISNFSLTNSSKNLNLSIEDIVVNKINIFKFRNESGLRFSNILPMNDQSEFAISDSYLGICEFHLIDFSKFASLRIVNSYIVNSAFLNIMWPKNIDAFKGSLEDDSEVTINFQNKIRQIENGEIKITKDNDVLSYYRQKRETLRQLKFAMGKQGDIITEQKFHSAEMITYDKTIEWKKDFWTKLVIKFSWRFSDFGQSIFKPLKWLFIGNFVLFFILLLAGVLSPLHLTTHNPTIQGFWDGLNQLFRLMNPLRRAENTLPGGWIIIDIIMRIWSSYMIYNLIRASRRFIK